MSEKPMSPHERAEKLMAGWPWINSVFLDELTTAFKSQSNADEARHREKQGALWTRLASALSERDAKAKRAKGLEQKLEALLDHIRNASDWNYKDEWQADLEQFLADEKIGWGECGKCEELMSERDAARAEAAERLKQLLTQIEMDNKAIAEWEKSLDASRADLAGVAKRAVEAESDAGMMKQALRETLDIVGGKSTPAVSVAFLCAGVPAETALVIKLEREKTTAARAREARLAEALRKCHQGLVNILEFRRMAGSDRYGNLTREEIEESAREIEAALAATDPGWLEGERRKAELEALKIAATAVKAQWERRCGWDKHGMGETFAEMLREQAAALEGGRG